MIQALLCSPCRSWFHAVSHREAGFVVGFLGFGIVMRRKQSVQGFTPSHHSSPQGQYNSVVNQVWTLKSRCAVSPGLREENREKTTHPSPSRRLDPVTSDRIRQ